jgi:hypothetical protein
MSETIAKLLNTKNETEQEQIIQELAYKSQAPVVVLTAALDTRNNKVDLLMNGHYTFDQMYAFLDRVRREVQQRERQAILTKEQTDTHK